MNSIQNGTTEKTSALESIKDFLKKKIVKPKALLDGLLYEETIGMLSGDTGAGKTWFTVHIGYAIAAGKPCKPWGTGAGVPVMYLDGESGEDMFDDRIKQIMRRDTRPDTREKGASNFHIFGKLWNDEIQDLDTVEGQLYIESLIATQKPKLIILDNLDTFCPTGLRNNSVYALFNKWLVSLTQRGIAVLLVHHNNKAGKQHGSSEKMRRLHYALSLKKSKEQGTEYENSFLLTLEKSRDKCTKIAPETRFVIRTEYDSNGELKTSVLQEDLFSAVDELRAEVKKLSSEGMSGKDIAEKLAVSESKVSRIKNKH